jgi:hypothetical protein
MAAITLTPVDITTAPVVVNSEILYHVFTINGVTRVFYGKGGKSPYQIDVQESAAAIAAASPNLVEVTTVNGTEYLFIGSGGAGPGLGIMFIEDDGSGGSKITFRYTEESGNTMFYSSDSPSTITSRINAQTIIPPIPPIINAASYQHVVQPISFAGDVNCFSNYVVITTQTWTQALPSFTSFNVFNQNITSSSVIKVYLQNVSNNGQFVAISPVYQETGVLALFFKNLDAVSSSFKIILEIIN